MLEGDKDNDKEHEQGSSKGEAQGGAKEMSQEPGRTLQSALSDSQLNVTSKNDVQWSADNRNMTLPGRCCSLGSIKQLLLMDIENVLIIIPAT